MKKSKSSGIFKYVKLHRCPRLTSDHTKARIEFSEKHFKQQMNLFKIICRVESKFNFDAPDINHSYWHEHRK